MQGAVQHGEGDVVSHDRVPQVSDQAMGGRRSEHEAKAEGAICLDGRKPDETRSCFVEGDRALDRGPWRLALKLNIHQFNLVRRYHRMIDAVGMNLCILDAAKEASLLQLRVVSERIAAKVEVGDARKLKGRVLVCNNRLRVGVLVDYQSTRVAGPVKRKLQKVYI